MICNFKNMNNVHFDYIRQKILKETQFIEKRMLVLIWYPTTKSGTKCIVEENVNHERLIERLEYFRRFIDEQLLGKSDR